VKYDTATPYLAAFVLFRRGDTVAFVLRKNTDWMNNYYGLIAGKVERDETCLAAAIREAKEESGIDLTPDQLAHVLTVHRKSEDGTYWIDVLFEAKSWQGEPFNAEPHKHSQLDWLDPDNLPENTIPVTRFYFEQLKAGHRFGEWGWSD
jgi:8-oxo-dGTP diphosphatase